MEPEELARLLGISPDRPPQPKTVADETLEQLNQSMGRVVPLLLAAKRCGSKELRIDIFRECERELLLMAGQARTAVDRENSDIVAGHA